LDAGLCHWADEAAGRGPGKDRDCTGARRKGLRTFVCVDGGRGWTSYGLFRTTLLTTTESQHLPGQAVPRSLARWTVAVTVTANATEAATVVCRAERVVDT